MNVFKTGESISIKCIVEDLVDLSTATYLFAIQDWKGENRLEIEPTVIGNEMSVILTPEQTQVASNYKYEFRIKVDQLVDRVHCGELILTDCIIKEMV